MIRLLAIFVVFALSACQGTLEFDDGGAVQDGSAALAAAPNAPATTPPPATAAPPATTPTTQTPPTETEQPPVDEPPVEEPVPEEPEEPALPEPGSTVDFEISQGTGTGAWNTAETAVVVYVGQVLRITNFDDENHRMHAADDAPVPHGGNLQPGQSEEYVVSSALAVGDQARMWDHDDGRSAAFWVEAREYPAP